MARALITGAAGFIGSHLAERLISRSWEVVGVDNFDPYYDRAAKERNLAALKTSSGGAPSAGRHRADDLDAVNLAEPSSPGRFHFVEGDIRDPELARSIARVSDERGGASAARSFDVLVHLAARAGVRPSVEDPALYSEVNLLGTTRMLELARALGIPKFVFASSSSVYGDRETAPFRETDCVDFPVSPYAATKKAGEVLCHAHHHLFGLAVSCLRFFTVYGPRQRPEMAIHKFTRSIHRGEPIKVYGDGSSRRDYTFISDIVDGIERSIDRASGYHIYNLGNHRTVELSELIDLIENALGRRAEIERLPPQPGDVPMTCAEINAAGRDLDYAPRVPIEEGIQRFADWFLAHA